MRYTARGAQYLTYLWAWLRVWICPTAKQRAEVRDAQAMCKTLEEQVGLRPNRIYTGGTAPIQKTVALRKGILMYRIKKLFTCSGAQRVIQSARCRTMNPICPECGSDMVDINMIDMDYSECTCEECGCVWSEGC